MVFLSDENGFCSISEPKLNIMHVQALRLYSIGQMYTIRETQ